jgi:hypothetical protein
LRLFPAGRSVLVDLATADYERMAELVVQYAADHREEAARAERCVGRPCPGQARVADALRLFVITWDPLEGIAPRPDGFATVNAGPPSLELVIYVPCWLLVEARWGGTVAGVLGAMAGSAVVTAAAHEPSVMSGRYPEQVIQGVAPDLLSDMSAGAALGLPAIRLVAPG